MLRFVDADDLFKLGVIPDKVIMEDTETGERVVYEPFPLDFADDGGMMRKVKHCPFCYSREQDVETLDKVWHVYCIECGAIGPDAKDRQTAIAKWNRRTNVDRRAENPLAE